MSEPIFEPIEEKRLAEIRAMVDPTDMRGEAIFELLATLYNLSCKPPSPGAMIRPRDSAPIESTPSQRRSQHS